MRSFSILLVWLVPVIAFVVVGYIGFKYYDQLGPRITLVISDASAIDVEKSSITMKGVKIGRVLEANLDELGEKVLVQVRLQKTKFPIAVEGSRFTLVKPEISLTNIKGLGTLIKGSFISVTPGAADGRPQKTFDVIESIQTASEQEDTSIYYLWSDTVTNVSVGERVIFKGFKIGEVTDIIVAENGQFRTQINIQNKYARLIRNNTKFWIVGGFKADIGLFGSEIEMQSVDSLMKGGIAVGTPNEVENMAKNFQKFTLMSEKPEEAEKWKPRFP